MKTKLPKYQIGDVVRGKGYWTDVKGIVLSISKSSEYIHVYKVKDANIDCDWYIAQSYLELIDD